MALDAHFYSGGLRVRRLGGDAAWPPVPPERFAGFRDEVPLDGQDQVVEIARLEIDGHRLWWIAIYRRSTDDQLPDRGNHAGVGVWIREGEVREPLLLLDGLRQLTAKLVEEGLDRVDQVARGFLAAEHLPQYVQPRSPMPAQLAGWRRAGGPAPVTALFATDATAAGAEWSLVADQIGRMSLLPGPSPEHSRAVILIRAEGSPRGWNLDRLSGGFGASLAARLPGVLSETAAENSALHQQVESARTDAAVLRSELQNLRTGEANAQARIVELEEQLDANDPNARFRSIESALTRVEAQSKDTGSSLGEVLRDLRDLRASIGASSRGDKQRDPWPSPRDDRPATVKPVDAGERTGPPTAGMVGDRSARPAVGARPSGWAGALTGGGSSSIGWRLQLLIGFLVAALAVMAALLLWSHWSTPELSSARDAPVTLSDAPRSPSDEGGSTRAVVIRGADESRPGDPQPSNFATPDDAALDRPFDAPPPPRPGFPKEHR